MPYKDRADKNENERKRLLRRKERGVCVTCARKAQGKGIRCGRCGELHLRLQNERMRTSPTKRKIASERMRRWKDSLRKQIIIGYGGKCKCCGETIPEFLTLDHKKNDGAECRKTQGHKSYGPTLYLRLVRENFPKEEFQLLCWNCNCAIGIFRGECPHKRKKAHDTRNPTRA